ncbi:hypothetical protein [Mesoflavibacter sp. SCSIO 43206]|uniref:hypothetical protein n=1 Tax=Mesoflavibacter sp. SCSIO 43206 TaxID=2779362 RepID=UPI001CA92403|nr:hypothetical protein [Mesoflavibacter sp. SCSIO 43206]UAB75562.1 hypothetical protein INR78_00810 [Mesoflavibacter sp. SCSIO 43206]
MLLNSDHCKLCDNKIVDFSRGTLCALTNERPTFSKTCPSIVLNKETEKQIIDTNIEFESTQKEKTNQVGLGIINMSIGIGIIILSMIITKFIFDKGFISTITLILFGVALVPMGKGIGTLNHYFTRVKIAKEKKEKLDKTLAFYNKSYNINIEHLKDSLGNIDHKVKLQILNQPINFKG